MTERDIRRWWRGLRIYQKQEVLGVYTGNRDHLAWKYLSCEEMKLALLGYITLRDVKVVRNREKYRKTYKRRKLQWDTSESMVSVERMLRLAGAA